MENFNDVSEAFIEWLQSVIIDRDDGAGGYVSGKWIRGGVTDVTIQAVVQNATPDDIKVVPEALRTSEILKLHTAFELKTVDEVGQENADLVNYRSAKWRVQSVADRKIGGYYKALAVRVKQ